MADGRGMLQPTYIAYLSSAHLPLLPTYLSVYLSTYLTMQLRMFAFVVCASALAVCAATCLSPRRRSGRRRTSAATGVSSVRARPAAPGRAAAGTRAGRPPRVLVCGRPAPAVQCTPPGGGRPPTQTAPVRLQHLQRRRQHHHHHHQHNNIGGSGDSWGGEQRMERWCPLP
eukprot:scaffold1422_cov297-Prasinococcus_capsulatus_cf.AAC.2